MILDRYYRVYIQPSGKGDYMSLNPEMIPSIEEITVDQEIDIAWEGKIKLKILADQTGKWRILDQELLRPFTRFRIEVKIGDSDFIPLIDGPLVGHNLSMSSEPGESNIILVFHDDSVYLNQNDEIEMYEGMTIQQIAQTCFEKYNDKITSTCIEPDSYSAPPITIQRGTTMQLLKFLAKKQGMHVYVLPGTEPGKSIGCFRSLPTKVQDNDINCTSASPPNTNEFEELVLLGPNRNIKSFDVKNNSQAPAKVKAFSLNVESKKGTSITSDPSFLGLTGDKMGYKRVIELPTRLLPSYAVGLLDQQQSISGETERLSYAIDASGSLLTNVYPNILQPYRMIRVKGASQEYSGKYLITQVTHKITPADYNQSFSMKGIAATENQGSSGG